MLNLVLVGQQEDLQKAFEPAGWVRTDKGSRYSSGTCCGAEPMTRDYRCPGFICSEEYKTTHMRCPVRVRSSRGGTIFESGKLITRLTGHPSGRVLPPLRRSDPCSEKIPVYDPTGPRLTRGEGAIPQHRDIGNNGRASGLKSSPVRRIPSGECKAITNRPYGTSSQPIESSWLNLPSPYARSSILSSATLPFHCLRNCSSTNPAS
jgi:hypothetical protein